MFRHPREWTSEPVLYQTPAQQERGEPPSVIGLQLHASGSAATEANSIFVGGRQADCASLGDRGATACVPEPLGPFYTFSSDGSVLAVFNALVETITHKQ